MILGMTKYRGGETLVKSKEAIITKVRRVGEGGRDTLETSGLWQSVLYFLTWEMLCGCLLYNYLLTLYLCFIHVSVCKKMQKKRKIPRPSEQTVACRVNH